MDEGEAAARLLAAGAVGIVEVIVEDVEGE